MTKPINPKDRFSVDWNTHPGHPYIYRDTEGFTFQRAKEEIRVHFEHQRDRARIQLTKLRELRKKDIP